MQTMPMQTRTLVPKHIIHMNHDLVSQIDFDGGTWPLIVDTNDIALESIWRGTQPHDVPVVNDGLCEGDVGEAQREK